MCHSATGPVGTSWNGFGICSKFLGALFNLLGYSVLSYANLKRLVSGKPGSCAAGPPRFPSKLPNQNILNSATGHGISLTQAGPLRDSMSMVVGEGEVFNTKRAKRPEAGGRSTEHSRPPCDTQGCKGLRSGLCFWLTLRCFPPRTCNLHVPAKKKRQT